MISAQRQVQITGCTWLLRRLVTAVRNRRGENEMTAQVWNVLQEGQFVSQRNVIEQNEMLVQLPHVAYVRNDRE